MRLLKSDIYFSKVYNGVFGDINEIDKYSIFYYFMKL